MNCATNDANLIAWWNNQSDNLNRYVPIFIYIFGIVGNCLNVLVLLQRRLRRNPSAAFLTVSSIAGFIVIVSGLTSRMMAGYAADLTLTVQWACISRNYAVYFARTVALWAIACATIDRWYSSNNDNNLRRKSNVKNAQRGIFLVLICACVVNIPILFCYDANLTGAIRGCYASTYACRVTTDVIYAVITTVLPLIIMVSFGLSTVKQVRRSRIRVQNWVIELSQPTNPVTRPKNRGVKKKDRHLLKMLLVQVTLLCLFTCGHAIQKAYTSIAAISSSKSLENAIENFTLTLFTLLNFTASGMPFYIYTLSGGPTFRNELFVLIKAVGRKILCQ